MIKEMIASRKRVPIVFLMASILCLNGPAIRAQEQPPKPPQSPEMQRLEEEKAQATLRKEIAEAEKAEAEARKAELEARFPAPTSTPLAGTTTINDGAVIESMMIAYASMAKAGSRIVYAIKDKLNHSLDAKGLAIYNERDINLLLSYKVANTQLEIIKQGYCATLTQRAAGDDIEGNPLCPTPGPAIEAAGVRSLSMIKSFLGGFVDLTAFLRTNVEIKGHSFDIDEAPLVSEVFRAARRGDGLPGVKLFYPHVFAPDINPDHKSEILKRLEDLNSLRLKAENLISIIVKTGGELEKSQAAGKQIKKDIKGLEEKRAGAVSDAVNLIKAHCPNVVVNESNVLARVQDIIERNTCRSMRANDRERLLAVGGIIKAVDLKIAEARDELKNEEANQATLTKSLEALKESFKASVRNKDELDNQIARLKSLNEQVNKVVGTLVQVDAATGMNPLTSYIRAENLKEAMPPGSHWLQLKVLKAGGNNRIKTNLIVDIFTGGSRLSHSGGAIVQYHLFNENGQSVLSDTIAEYTDYIKASKVKDLPNIRFDDCILTQDGRLNCSKPPVSVNGSK